MILCDFHCHTTFCDGKNTPEEMVISAIEKGMTELGLLCHSYTFFDERYCIKKDKVNEFIIETNRLKEKYADRIKLYCGVEQDYYSDFPTTAFDYIIGSAHYMLVDDYYYSLDSKSEWFFDMLNKKFGGDFNLLAEKYYEIVANVVEKTGADIIGHFDIISKWIENEDYSRLNRPEYLAAAKKAVDKLIPYGKPFEINIGAIARGLRTHPYPSAEIIGYIKKKGGKLILSSDCHSKENLMFQFDNWEHLL